MSNKNRPHPQTGQQTSAASPAEHMRQQSSTRLTELPQPYPPPPMASQVVRQNGDADQPPPPPPGHAGAPLPQTEAEMQQAAQEAALQPVSPTGLPPFMVPGPAGQVLPPLPPGTQPPPHQSVPFAHLPPHFTSPTPGMPRLGSQANPHLHVMQQLTQQLLNSHAMQGFAFYLATQPEDGLLRVEQFDTIEKLQQALIAAIGTEAAVVPFMGHHLKVSKGPWRYLVTPFGNLPLFNVPGPGEIEVDDSGWLGKQSQELVIPERPQEDDLDDVVDVPVTAHEGPLFTEGNGNDSPI